MQHVRILLISPVGAGLLANAVGHPTLMHADPPLSRASPLPHWIGVCRSSGRGRPRSRARFPAPAPASLRPARCPGATR
ncbi:hypothetical protein EYC95_02010 [Pseudomonas sp. BGI-2]|nr:hypothetical protein EYC95_02010 [Pseudomonas sp. BGI-2]